MNRKLLVCLLVAFPLFTAAREAWAVNGVVKGRWMIWNKNGNYCPTGRDCTGAVYTEAQFGKPVPARNTKVYVANDTVGIIGEGRTDNEGYYTISWSYPGGSLPGAAGTYTFWNATHWENRFYLRYTSGQYRWWATPAFTPTNGTTAGNPQYVGDWASAQWDEWANAYFAGEIAWREAIGLVGVEQQNFTNVEIRGFADDVPGFMGKCGTSCANGASKRIQLDANAGFTPQARVMHEMGHIATYQAKPWTLVGGSFGAYCYPDKFQPTGTTCGWSFDSAEWAVSSFEEALATWIADSALYFPHAVVPTSCNSSGACSATFDNLETSLNPAGPVNNCGSDSWRTARNAMRYFWDVYDDRDDGEQVVEGWDYWRILGNLASYPEGTGVYQHDEPWNSARTGLDDHDGRDVTTYDHNFQAAFGVWWNAPNDLNCNPN